MNELSEALTGESAHASPAHILDPLSDQLVHKTVPGAPHSIYQEVWHLAFWQHMTLDWINGIETAYPASVTDPFPSAGQTDAEPWLKLRSRFLDGTQRAASATNDPAHLSTVVRCTSRPGHPVRLMTVQDQLISLAAHNAYHLGRIVLLRQLLGSWPPPSGGFTW